MDHTSLFESDTYNNVMQCTAKNSRHSYIQTYDDICLLAYSA